MAEKSECSCQSKRQPPAWLSEWLVPISHVVLAVVAFVSAVLGLVLWIIDTKLAPLEVGIAGQIKVVEKEIGAVKSDVKDVDEQLLSVDDIRVIVAEELGKR